MARLCLFPTTAEQLAKSFRSEFIYTPTMEAKWAKVIGAARRREDTDPATWSIDLVGDPSEPELKALIDKTKSLMKVAHGEKPKVSRHGMPIRKEMIRDDEGEEQPSGLVVLKAKRFEQRRGSDAKNSGPIVVNSQNEPWPSDVLIGNGSLVRAKIHYYSWDRGSEGVGLSAELHAVQVIKHVEYESAGTDISAGFAPVEGGCTLKAEDSETVDEFAAQLREAAEKVGVEEEEFAF